MTTAQAPQPLGARSEAAAPSQPRLPWGLFPGLRIGVFRLTYGAQDEVVLPTYQGSVLRGAFGSAFRRISCPARSPRCTGCPHQAICPYAYVFETAPSPEADILHNLQDVPRPFVLEVGPPGPEPRSLASGDCLELGLVLVGRAVDYLPHCLAALREMGLTGIGPRRSRFQLQQVWQVDPSAFTEGSTQGPVVYSAGARIRIRSVLDGCLGPNDVLRLAGRYPGSRIRLVFESMTRLKHGDKLSDRPDLHILVRSLLRRVSSLAYFHHGTRLDADFRAIITWSEEVHLVDDATKWTEWSRYSNRQDSAMKLGGITGAATYEGPIQPLIPLLVLGSLVHVGKNVTFGLGKYHIEEA